MLQISKLFSGVFFELYMLRRIVTNIKKDNRLADVGEVCKSHLDYCNCLHAGLPGILHSCMQRVHDVAVRLAGGMPTEDCVSELAQTFL